MRHFDSRRFLHSLRTSSSLPDGSAGLLAFIILSLGVHVNASCAVGANACVQESFTKESLTSSSSFNLLCRKSGMGKWAIAMTSSESPDAASSNTCNWHRTEPDRPAQSVQLGRVSSCTVLSFNFSLAFASASALSKADFTWPSGNSQSNPFRHKMRLRI